MSKCLKPLGYRVLLKIPPTPEKTKYSIELPTNYLEREQDNMDEGIIVAYGEYAFSDMIEDPIDYPKIGTIAYFVKYAGKSFKKDDVDYRVMNDTDIYGIEGESND